MSQQVITVAPDGSLAGLQHKPTQGIDLRQFGKAKIERASEVLWDEDTQHWYVEFRKGVDTNLDGVKLTLGMHRQVNYTEQTEDEKQMIIFKEYDDAVQAEIKYLNWIRANNLITK